MSALETYYLYSNVTGPLSLFSAVVCGIATITSYIYPAQRKFPNAVLLWTCLNDCLSCLLTAMGWIPGPVKVHLTERAVEPKLCSFLVYVDWAVQQSASMLSLLLAYTLFATIVQKIDLHETREKYYLKFQAIFWLPTLLIPLFTLLEISHSVNVGFCAPKTQVVIVIKQLSWFIPFILQIILIIPVFKVVYTVTQSVRSSLSERSHQNRGRLWLCARFIGAQCNQVVIWFPGNVWQCITLTGGTPPWALNVVIASSWAFPSLNGFIVLAGNTPLRHSIQDFCSRFSTYCSPRKYTQNASELSTLTL